MSPGENGTCWCCGEPVHHDVFELCLECEVIRSEIFITAEAVA